jgi:hypothetical protein
MFVFQQFYGVGLLTLHDRCTHNTNNISSSIRRYLVFLLNECIQQLNQHNKC